MRSCIPFKVWCWTCHSHGARTPDRSGAWSTPGTARALRCESRQHPHGAAIAFGATDGCVRCSQSRGVESGYPGIPRCPIKSGRHGTRPRFRPLYIEYLAFEVSVGRSQPRPFARCAADRSDARLAVMVPKAPAQVPSSGSSRATSPAAFMSTRSSGAALLQPSDDDPDDGGSSAQVLPARAGLGEIRRGERARPGDLPPRRRADLAVPPPDGRSQRFVPPRRGQCDTRSPRDGDLSERSSPSVPFGSPLRDRALGCRRARSRWCPATTT